MTILAEFGDYRRFRSSRRGPLRGPRHHRLAVGRAPLARTPLAAGAAGASLGAVRGGASRLAAELAHRDYYEQASERLGANRACLAIARKLLKRSYHTLCKLGEEALQPA